MTIPRVCVVILALTLGASIFGVRAFSLPTEQEQPLAGGAIEKDATAEFAKQQVAVARHALATLEQLRTAGVLGKFDDSFDVWRRRLIDALRNGGGSHADLIEALKKYAEHAKLNLKGTEALLKDGKTSQTQWYDAQYQHLEAQSWLAEEQGD